MSPTTLQIFVNLLISVVISLLAYNHYKQSTKELKYKYLTFSPRFIAPSIDGLVLWPIIGGSQLLMSSFDLPSLLVIPLTFVIYTVHYIYTIYFHAKCGQTIGKMVCKIKVVTASDEANISIKSAIIRDSIPIVMTIFFFVTHIDIISAPDEEVVEFFQANSWLSYIPSAWFIAEVITMLTNEKRRALHDFIAGTVVIRTNIEEDV
jgi:uncharacterized RDD family membrane protein YckC